MDNYGGRKFFIAAVSLFASIAGLFFGKIDDNVFFMLVTAVLALYGYHNVKAREMDASHKE